MWPYTITLTVSVYAYISPPFTYLKFISDTFEGKGVIGERRTQRGIRVDFEDKFTF
jgi:hypothetical protein